MSRGVLSHEIIFCSFTRAAAHEARKRAIDSFGGTVEDYPWFSTEHSICFRLLGLTKDKVLTRCRLREFGERYNYQFSDDSNDEVNLDERYNEGMLRSVADHYEAFVSYMANRMLGLDEAHREFMRSTGYETPDGFTKSGLEVYIERREKYKQENNLWSFDDMIRGALQRDLFPEGAKVLICDEVQDSSKLLYTLIRRWSEKVDSYYIAGDPLQAIYQFSGASPELFFEFPGEEEVMGHSYRLTPQVKYFAQRIIERTDLAFPHFTPADRQGILIRQPFSSVDWRNTGDCFLLARTRWLLSLYAGYFMSLGVPYKTERGRHSPLTNSRGRAFYTLFKLSQEERVSDTELAALVKHTGAPWLARGAKTRVRNLVEGMYWWPDLSDMGFTDKFMTNMRHGDFGSILCRDIEDSDRHYLARVLKSAGPSAFEEEPQLVLTTIHGSKGREKPSVYLCPDLTRRVWEGYARNRESESLVFYVAATRAIDKLVILTPQQRYGFPLPR